MKVTTLDLGFKNLDHAIAAFVVPSSAGLCLVETGPYATFAHLESQLAQHGWSVSDVRAVFLTHIHFDHAGAAWALARQGATIYVHPVGMPHLISPERLYNSARKIYGEQMDALWGAMEPIEPDKIHAPADGETIRIGDQSFTAWYTPGHATHHIAWQWQDTLFTGDVAGIRIENGPAMPPCPPPDIHIEDWQASIDRLRALPASKLYLTHFGPVDDKLAHLQALEEQLLAWAAWMKPHFEAGTPAEQIVPGFEAFVRNTLLQYGLTAPQLDRYEAANPAYMSVAGLLRYWKKKTETP